jgi:Tol biopolymer transport system component
VSRFRQTGHQLSCGFVRSRAVHSNDLTIPWIRGRRQKTLRDNCAAMHKSVSALLVVVAALVAGQGAAGGGGQTGASEAIVFGRAGDLYALAVNGSRTVRLTKTGARELQPAVSPDGRSIAYARRGYELWTMSVDGKHRRRLTQGHDFSPAWSPDGDTIFFSRDLPLGKYGIECASIFRVGTDGRDVRPVTRSVPSEPARWREAHSHYDAAVSPDGRRIVFTDENGCEGGQTTFSLRVVDTSGRRTGDLSRLPGNAYSWVDPDHDDPTWSPDGSRIAFQRSLGSRSVYVANRDGSGLRRVTPRGASDPAWSPDGAWIAYVSHADLYMVHPDGTGRRRLTRTPEGEYPALPGAEYSPAWLQQMPSG